MMSVGRTILLTGAMGSGKSALLSLGYRTKTAYLGKTASIDTDVMSMMIDPTFELADEDRHLDLTGYQCWMLTKSFLEAGFETVIIGGNGFHTPEEGLNDMVSFLLTAGEVFHVTLDPSTEETQRRVAHRGSAIGPNALADHVQWMRDRQRPWTCRIDNTQMTPEQTLGEIAARIRQGEGHITGVLPTTTG